MTPAVQTPPRTPRKRRSANNPYELPPSPEVRAAQKLRYTVTSSMIPLAPMVPLTSTRDLYQSSSECRKLEDSITSNTRKNNAIQDVEMSEALLMKQIRKEQRMKLRYYEHLHREEKRKVLKKQKDYASSSNDSYHRKKEMKELKKKKKEEIKQQNLIKQVALEKEKERERELLLREPLLLGNPNVPRSRRNKIRKEQTVFVRGFDSDTSSDISELPEAWKAELHGCSKKKQKRARAPWESDSTADELSCSDDSFVYVKMRKSEM